MKETDDSLSMRSILTHRIESRKENMITASIKKRGTVWQVRVSYKDADGTHRTKNKSGFTTKKEAQIFANKYENMSLNNELTKETKILFKDYFRTWYETYKQPTLSYRSQKSYENTYHLVIKYFPNDKLIDITRADYQAFIKKFGEHRSREHVRKTNAHIRSCVRNAVYDDLIKKDFTDRVVLIFDKSREQDVEYLSIAEQKKLVKNITTDINSNYTSRYMILTAIYTGMRLGEIQGLQWRDINFNFKTISIERAWSELLKDYKDVKSDSSKRVIRINDSLINYLKQLEPENKTVSKDTPVFINQFGTIPTSNAVNKVLRKFVTEHKDFHFHSLRHGHVAYLLANNIDLYLISKRLGHSNIAITSKYYAYLIDEYKVRGDNQIEKIMENLKPRPIKKIKKAK
jgi:integrase